jgi:hypothetical protein
MKRLRTLLILDTILLLALIVLMEPRSSLTVHEWLGLAVIVPLVMHLLFAWQWIATTLARLAAKGAWRLRINAVLNTALFIALVVTILSGTMASLVVLPSLGVVSYYDESWRRLHNDWSLYFQLLAGLHLAMNWSWILGTVRRLLLRRPTARGDAAIAAVSGEAPQAEP